MIHYLFALNFDVLNRPTNYPQRRPCYNLGARFGEVILPKKLPNIRYAPQDSEEFGIYKHQQNFSAILEEFN